MPKYQTELTAERLRDLLSYDLETGDFRWRIRTSNCIHVGDVAGCQNTNCYLQIRVDRRLYLAHRLAWLYVHGRWPNAELDHRNGVRTDNRIENLREATRSENCQNIGRSPRSATGHKGVYCRPDKKKWWARIQLSGKKHYLGSFDSLDAAVEARSRAKAELHTFQPVGRESAP